MNRHLGQMVKYHQEVKIVRLQEKSAPSSPVRPLRVWQDKEDIVEFDDVDSQAEELLKESQWNTSLEEVPQEVQPEIEISLPRVAHRGYSNMRTAIIDKEKPSLSIDLEV